MFLATRSVMVVIKRLNLIVLLALLVSFNIKAKSVNNESNEVINSLNLSLKNQDASALYSIENQINSLWRGEKKSEKNWKDLREVQLVTLLRAVEVIEKQINWQFNLSVSADDTLEPPLDHKIMMYHRGIGISQIKDPNERDKIKTQLKAELERLRIARESYSFRRQVRAEYLDFLWAYIRFLSNHYNEPISENKTYLEQTIVKVIANNELRSCLKRITEFFYDFGHSDTLDFIKKHKGHCCFILKGDQKGSPINTHIN